VSSLRSLPVGRSAEMRRITLFLDEAGVPWRPRAEQIGLPPHVPSGETFLPTHLVLLLLGDIVVRENYPEMTAQAYSDRDNNVKASQVRGRVERALLSAPTLYGGLRAFCKMSRLEWSHLRFWLRETHDVLWFCSVLPVTGNLRGIEQLVQARIIGLVGLIQQYLGRLWRPDTLLLETPTIPSRMLSEVIECRRIIPGASFSAVPIPKSLLTSSGPSYQLAAVSPLCDDFNADEIDWQWLKCLQAILPEYVIENQVSIDQVAEIVKVSSRTLQRALSNEGTSFRELVANARLEVARKQLADTSMTIEEISRLLGYSEATHFTRAFRHFSGLPPSEYRRALTQEA
jgi:AraC-like DNA-binding protein